MSPLQFTTVNVVKAVCYFGEAVEIRCNALWGRRYCEAGCTVVTRVADYFREPDETFYRTLAIHNSRFINLFDVLFY